MERKTASRINKRTLSFTFLSLILLLACIPTSYTHNASFPVGYDPTILVIDVVGDPDSMDPAWSYYAPSMEVIQNVYEPLIFFDVKYQDGPYNAGKTDEFVPKLATALPTIDYTSSEINPLTGMPYYSTWYFPIRTGVQFHNGWGTLTPADVEYSFEREMVQDRDGGPQWMLFEPLLQEYYADPGPDGGVKINNAVKSNSTHVWFNLAWPYPELAFKQILCQSLASVVCKAWAISRGDFDGNWAANWETLIYPTWHNPEVSFLDSPDVEMVGTGPYEFSYWNSGTDYSVVRNAAYWGGWPARVKPDSDPDPAKRLGGYIERATWREIASWTVRRGNFLSGSSDTTYVPSSYVSQVLGQIVGGEKVRCHYPLQSLSVNAFFYTFDIDSSSPYCGVMQPPGTFSTAGIPPDLFSDINVRKGFACAFNYTKWLAQAYQNMGIQPADPVIEGIAYDNVLQQKYSYKLTGPYSAEYYLKLAWGGSDPNNDGIVASGDEGDLWTGGMKFQIVYNIGNVPRELASIEISDEINSLNPSMFLLEPLGQDYGTQYLPAMIRSELPIFFNGFSADYADPHNLVFPFMHTYGAFPGYQRYSNIVVDAIIEAGIATPDDTTPYDNSLDNANGLANLDNKPAGDWRTWPTNSDYYVDNPLDNDYPRRSVYYALQELYHEDVPSVPLFQPVGRHWEQAWMRGWYYNPLYPGLYVYHLWKAKTHFGDVSGPTYGIADGIVDTYDLGFITAHYSQGGIYGYHPVADIDGGIGATTGGEYGYVAGMPDGKVDIRDLELVSDQWDNPPGLTHGGPSQVHIHDVAITSVTPSSTEVYVGKTLDIEVTAKNEGTRAQTFQVKAYYDSSLIGTPQTVTNLAPSAETTLTFNWNTASVTPGSYSISAKAPEVSGEDDTADNSLTDGTVAVIESTVSVEPRIIVGPPPKISETFTVDINITDARDLYTWQAGMTFNPSVLEALSIEEGEFLKRAGVPTLWTPGSINNFAGTISHSACSITDSTPGVNGNGQLMNITFRVKNSGISTLHITDVLLLDSDTPQVPIEPVNIVDGYVEIHVQDIAILSVTTSATEAYPTWIVPLTITVVVENQGTRTEEFDVKVYANFIAIGTKTVTLAAGERASLVYNWDLASVAEGTYIIRAEATILYGEIDTADNTLTDGTVKIKHPGDANNDGVLDAYDLGILAKAWGTHVGEPLYDPRADFNGDGEIDDEDHGILKAYWP